MKIKITSFIVGFFVCLFLGLMWSNSKPVHPDEVFTVYNRDLKTKTFAYLIGDVQLFIEETMRMPMSSFKIYVAAEGKKKDETFDTKLMFNENLVLDKTKGYDENPFIVKLKIKNLYDKPLLIRANQFKIITEKGDEYLPNETWTETLAMAGMFSGSKTNEQNVLNPKEEKTLWLVYGTKKVEGNGLSKDIIRMQYGGEGFNDYIYVDIPFNYYKDFEIGNANEIHKKSYMFIAAALLVYSAVAGGILYKLN